MRAISINIITRNYSSIHASREEVSVRIGKELCLFVHMRTHLCVILVLDSEVGRLYII
jgi:hypothetical protein